MFIITNKKSMEKLGIKKKNQKETKNKILLSTMRLQNYSKAHKF